MLLFKVESLVTLQRNGRKITVGGSATGYCKLRKEEKASKK